MKWPYLAWALHSRRIIYLDAAAALKISSSTFTHKMQGRIEFAPHEQTRLAELIGLRKEFLFTEIVVPESARLLRQPLGNFFA